MTAPGEAHKNSHANCHADRNCEHDKGAMLELFGKAAQCIVTELRRILADVRSFSIRLLADPNV